MRKTITTLKIEHREYYNVSRRTNMLVFFFFDREREYIPSWSTPTVLLNASATSDPGGVTTHAMWPASTWWAPAPQLHGAGRQLADSDARSCHRRHVSSPATRRAAVRTVRLHGNPQTAQRDATQAPSTDAHAPTRARCTRLPTHPAACGARPRTRTARVEKFRPS